MDSASVRGAAHPPTAAGAGDTRQTVREGTDAPQTPSRTGREGFSPRQPTPSAVPQGRVRTRHAVLRTADGGCFLLTTFAGSPACRVVRVDRFTGELSRKCTAFCLDAVLQ